MGSITKLRSLLFPARQNYRAAVRVRYHTTHRPEWEGKMAKWPWMAGIFVTFHKFYCIKSAQKAVYATFYTLNGIFIHSDTFRHLWAMSMLPRHRKYFFNSRPQGCASGFLQACPWLFTGQAYVPTYHFIDFMALAIAYNAIKKQLKRKASRHLLSYCSLPFYKLVL